MKNNNIINNSCPDCGAWASSKTKRNKRFGKQYNVIREFDCGAVLQWTPKSKTILGCKKDKIMSKKNSKKVTQIPVVYAPRFKKPHDLSGMELMTVIVSAIVGVILLFVAYVYQVNWS